MTRKLIDGFYVDIDPNAPEKGWGLVYMDVETARSYNIPTKQPESRTDKHGRRINFPSRGRAGLNKMSLKVGWELVPFKAQKRLTVKAICAWAKTWAPLESQIISPGGQAYDLEGERASSGKVHYVYFILNRDSNAIKIGRARDIQKRLAALQTASPAELELLKAVQVRTGFQSQQLEVILHSKFRHLRIRGEWFRAEPELLQCIEAESFS